MEDVQDKKLALKKYLKKLINLVERETRFAFSSYKIVKSHRIDDVLCCIESSWPEDYKKYINQYGTTKLKTPKIYTDLIKVAKRKFFIPSFCLVDIGLLLQITSKIISSLELDLKYIYKEKSGMF